MRHIIVILTAFLIVGCTKTVYVPTNTVKTEYRDRVQFDSIYCRDSILVMQRGDTVYIYKDRYIFRDKLIRDTVCRVDSVSYSVIVEVEKQVKYIPKAYKWGLWFSVVVIGAAFLWVVGKFKLRLW